MSDLRTPSREWDPDRPALAALLARREELGASYVDMSDGVARFNTSSPDAAVQAMVRTGTPTPAQSALASLAAIPKAVVEEFDLDALIAEQVTQTEQVMAALRGETMTFEVLVRTRVQPLVPMDMPPDGIDVYLSVQVGWQPLRAKMLMPFTADPDEHGQPHGWAEGRVHRPRPRHP